MGASRLLLGLVGLLVAALLAIPAAATAATGTISGTVTGAGAGPLNGARVCARSDSSSFSFPCTTTDASGAYSLPNLEAGGYRVEFEGTGEFIGQWFGGVESEEAATDVAVVGGATTTGIDAELVRGAALEGTIRDATSQAPLAAIRACATGAAGNPFGNHCATSEANGHYRIVGIPTGVYKLRLEPEFGTGDPDYLTQFWPGAQTNAGGTAISLTNGSTKAGVDVAMRLGGTISGRVVDEEGHPAQGFSVCIYPVLGNTNFAYCMENRAETAGDGTYTIHGVDSGEYKIEFFGGTGNHLAQWYPDQTTRAGAAAVTVTAPEAVSGIDATLRAGGVISGTLREAGTHAPLAFAEVCARPLGGTNLYCTQTKAGGEYSIGALRSREYVVEFAGPNSSADWPYVPSFSGGTTDPASATPVAVTAGAVSGGVDGEVEKGGTIAGLVTDGTSHEPASGIYACAYSGGAVAGHCDTTGAAGEYKIVGLPAGSYAVRFVPAAGGPDQNFRIGNKHYVDEFYEAALSEATATPVTSGPGIAKTGIDVEMHEGGGIAGTIFGPLGEPLRAGYACVVESGDDLGRRCAEADVAGRYEITGLSPGSYRVRFVKLGAVELAPRYFDEVETFGEATPVSVVGTAVTPGIDAHLVPGGTVEGTVVDAFDGTPIAGAWVCAETFAEAVGNCVESGTEGHYAMEVDPGTYRVKFSLGYEEFETEIAEFTTAYFGGTTDAAAATPVEVASGDTVTGIDVALSPASGRLDTVSVGKAGGGAGAIVSSPAGIDCGATCTESFETRKTVTLSAEAAPGSVFAGWTGACAGTGQCQVRLTGVTNVTATFKPAEAQSPPPQTSPPPAVGGPGPPKPQLRCKRGFHKTKVKGKSRCVKTKPRKKHPHRHHAPHS